MTTINLDTLHLDDGAHDYPEQGDRLRYHVAEPLGMRPDGTVDPRIEAGKDALIALGVPVREAWAYADAVLGTVYTREDR